MHKTPPCRPGESRDPLPRRLELSKQSHGLTNDHRLVRRNHRPRPSPGRQWHERRKGFLYTLESEGPGETGAALQPLDSRFRGKDE